MPPSRPPKKKPIRLQFTTGAPKGEPTKKVAALHHEIRTLKNRVIDLETELERQRKFNNVLNAGLSCFREPPRRALAMLANWPLSRVVEVGAIESVVPLVEWWRDMETYEKKFAALQADVAAGKVER